MILIKLSILLLTCVLVSIIYTFISCSVLLCFKMYLFVFTISSYFTHPFIHLKTDITLCIKYEELHIFDPKKTFNISKLLKTHLGRNISLHKLHLALQFKLH